MAKFKKIAPILALVFGILAFVCMFLAAVKAEAGGQTGTTSFMSVTFGNDEDFTAFSFGNFVTFLLIIVGLVFSVIALIKKLGKVSSIVATAAFLIGGILFFCAKTFMKFDSALGEYADMMKDMCKLGTGAVLGGIAAIIAAVFSIVPVFIKGE